MNQSFPPRVHLEDVDCPNGCQREDVFVLKGKDLLHNIPGEFSIYRCQKCGLERTTPRPTPDTIGTYYPSDYAPYQDEASAKAGLKQSWKELILKIFGLRSRILPSVKPGRMLEVGCSSGNYMEQARAAGWSVDGIEFSPEAAAIARDKGFSVQTGALEKLNSLSLTKYDLITGWMVLEHLHEPVAALRKLREWIKADGYLVASVPSAESLSRKMFGSYSYDLQLPNHLFHFTPQTLAKVMKNSGWQIERVFWQRNCNTLLNSCEYWAVAYKKPIITKIVRWVRTGAVSLPLRGFLRFILGVTHQSGRIEIWARPTVDASNSGLDMQNNSRPVEV